MALEISEQRLRYLLSWGLNQKQIGEILGVSQQVVSYRVKKLRSRYPGRL